MVPPDRAPGEFAAATTVEPAGPGRWAAQVHPGWDVVGNAHGGYLLSIVGRAMAAATGRPDPVTVTAHYLRPASTGAIDVTTAVLRSGRRFATARATLADGDGELVAALGTFGSLAGDPAGHPTLLDGAPPELPAPSACAPVEPGDPFPPTFTGRLDLLLHPDDAGFMRGVRSGEARIRGWVGLADGELVDPVSLLTIVDAFPPTVFNVDLPIAWVPTLEITAHVRARPAPGLLAAEVRTRFISGGVLEIDGEFWDQAGALVAQSRQLALVPRSG